MNLSKIIGIIKTFLPANSPWTQRIDQAAELAKGYAPSKDGVSQLMEAYGKNKADLHKAVGMLENPIFKNMLSRIPGLGQVLNNAANDLMNDPNVGSSKMKGDMDCGANSVNDGAFESLQARLNRLK